MTFDRDLDLEHTLDAGSPVDHRVQVWSRSGHLPGRRSDFPASTKVPVSRDLWLWPWPWAHPGCTLTSPGIHRVQVWWRSGHLPARIDGGCKFTRIHYIVYIVDKLIAILRGAAIAGGRSNDNIVNSQKYQYIRAVYLINYMYIQHSNGTDTAFHWTYSCSTASGQNCMLPKWWWLRQVFTFCALWLVVIVCQ